jgi:hypothetical protein
MSRRKPSPFTNCETKEGFLVALQSQLASGKLTEAEFNAARLLCKLKGWDTPSKTSEASVTPEVTIPTVAPGGDGNWYWRENLGSHVYRAWNGIDAATMPNPDSKPWHGPFTADEMVAEANRITAEGREFNVKTPRGNLFPIWCEPPCTLEKLESINAAPARSLNDPW